MDEKKMESWSPDAVWGKQGEWTMYQQHEQAEPGNGQDAEWDSGKKEKLNDYVRGCLVFYIDVGQLPPFKAEAFVERMKQQLNDRDGLCRIKKDQEVFFIPVRGGRTRVEYIPFN